MSKAPVKYQIEGRTFIVDVKYAELREQDRPMNVITFAHMQDKTDSYEFSFDRKSGTITSIMSMEQDITKVVLPQMVALDPEGMAEKYGVAVSELTASDAQMKTSSLLLPERLAGNLPKIDIGGRLYFVDQRLMQLRATDDPFTMIDLKTLDMSMDGKYLALYDQQTHRLVSWDEHTVTLPGQTRMLVIPSEVWLDPVGLALQHGLDRDELLKKYPVQAVHKAELYPLSVTGFPKKMQQNRQKLATKQNKPNAKRKRGLRP